MKSTHVGGVDPGIVHTGCVQLDFYPGDKTIVVSHEVVSGTDAAAVDDWFATGANGRPDHLFIEHYRIRGVGSQHDKAMLVAVNEMKKATGGTVLDNTGVKKIVKPGILMALGAWVFSTPTHHDDLRSAARIAVLGMMKHPDMNRLLADVIRDHLDGKPWTLN